MKTTIGLGFDIHRLKKGIPLFLGGTEIPFPKGLAGHSDGDCLVHAMIDALLGALGEGDIGQFFPDDEEEFKDIRSTELLQRVAERLVDRKANVLHMDSVIFAQEPKLAPFIPSMKDVICPLLKIKPAQLGIKAKTGEKIGVVGKKKAVASWATVLVALAD